MDNIIPSSTVESPVTGQTGVPANILSHTSSSPVIPGLDSSVCLNILDILDSLPFYVLLVDQDHNIIEANRAVQLHLNVRQEDIVGKYCPKVVHGLDEPFHGCPLEDAAQENRAIERELKDEKTGRWVISAIYPTRALTPGGKRIFLHMVTDITEKKQAQEQLKASHKQLRLLSAHLQSVREEEKQAIARDLHDETSQLLASLSAHLEAAIGTLPEGSDKTSAMLRKAQNISTTILDEVHKLIHELRPSVLDKLGLMAAVNSLIDNNLKATGLKVNFKTVGQVKRLPPSLEIALFRIIQETFTNILKHAHADRVYITVRFTKNSIRVQIKDNGVGFNVNKVVNPRGTPRGWGLLGVRERVDSVNGTLNIVSSPGQGTELIIRVPVSAGVENG